MERDKVAASALHPKTFGRSVQAANVTDLEGFRIGLKYGDERPVSRRPRTVLARANSDSDGKRLL